MGLQISSGVDNEVPLSGLSGRRWTKGEGIAPRDSAEHGVDDLRGLDQSRPCAYADRDTAAHIGIEGGAVPEGKKLAQDAIGVSESEEAILGAAPMGQGILGIVERQCD